MSENLANVDEQGTMEVLVRQATWEADGILSLQLTLPNGGELPAWTPGAHIDLVLPSGRVRQYSLCGDRSDLSAYRIAILRERNGRGGSAEIHDTNLVGQTLRCRPPRNHFALIEAANYIFIAGGVGITPILPMIHEAEAAKLPWHLYYGGRTIRTMAFLNEIRTFDNANIDFLPEEDSGLLNILEIVRSASEESAIYCCGPPGLLNAIETCCDNEGRSSQLHVERFSQVGVETNNSASNNSFTVVLQRSGLELQVPPDHTLLDVVRSAIPQVLYDCEEGYCGSCETRVLEGIPEHRDTILTDEERKENEIMMICVGRSKSPVLVLDI